MNPDNPSQESSIEETIETQGAEVPQGPIEITKIADLQRMNIDQLKPVRQKNRPQTPGLSH